IADFPLSHDIWITLLIAAAGARIVPVDQKLIRYRLHSSNVVGLQNHNLLSQIRAARRQLTNGAFEYAVDLHEAVLDRVISAGVTPPGIERTRALLANKISHARLRHEMPQSLL